MEPKEKEKPEENITRKEALAKAGKYAAFTVAASVMLLTPKESQAQSELPMDRGTGW